MSMNSFRFRDRKEIVSMLSCPDQEGGPPPLDVGRTLAQGGRVVKLTFLHVDAASFDNAHGLLSYETGEVGRTPGSFLLLHGRGE